MSFGYRVHFNNAVGTFCIWLCWIRAFSAGLYPEHLWNTRVFEDLKVFHDCKSGTSRTDDSRILYCWLPGQLSPALISLNVARPSAPIRAPTTVPLYVTKPWRQKQEFSSAWWSLLHEAGSCHGPQSSRDGIHCSCYFWPRHRDVLFAQEFLRWVSSRDDWSVLLSHQPLCVLLSNLHRLSPLPRKLSWFVDLIDWSIFPRMPNNSFLTSLNAPLSEW